MNNLKGFAFGILTSATFGLIPLFTLPLMAKGMQFDSILFYRFLFAALALTGMMTVKKESFKVEKREIPILVLLGFFIQRLPCFFSGAITLCLQASPRLYILPIRYL